MLKMVKLAKAARVAGGQYSCTPTSVAKAVQRLSLSFATVEDVTARTGSGISPINASYSGAWIEQVLPNIGKIVCVEKHAVMGFSDIESPCRTEKWSRRLFSRVGWNRGHTR